MRTSLVADAPPFWRSNEVGGAVGRTVVIDITPQSAEFVADDRAVLRLELLVPAQHGDGKVDAFSR